MILSKTRPKRRSTTIFTARSRRCRIQLCLWTPPSFGWSKIGIKSKHTHTKGASDCASLALNLFTVCAVKNLTVFVADSPRCLEWSSMVVAVSRALRELSEPCLGWTREPRRQPKLLGTRRQYSQATGNNVLPVMTGSPAFLTRPPPVNHHTTGTIVPLAEINGWGWVLASAPPSDSPTRRSGQRISQQWPPVKNVNTPTMKSRMMMNGLDPCLQKLPNQRKEKVIHFVFCVKIHVHFVVLCRQFNRCLGDNGCITWHAVCTFWPLWVATQQSARPHLRAPQGASEVGEKCSDSKMGKMREGHKAAMFVHFLHHANKGSFTPCVTWGAVTRYLLAQGHLGLYTTSDLMRCRLRLTC